MSNDMVKMLNSFWRTLFEGGKYFLKVVPRFRHWPKEVSKAISWILPSSCCYFTFLSGVLSLSSQGVWRGESHRVADIWRYIQGSADPAFLLKQGHLELVAWDHVRLDFAYLQRWRLHKISRLFLLVISQLQSKKVFPFVQTGPSVFGFVPISYEYSLLCLPYILPFRRMKFHISLLFSRLNSHSFVNLSSWEMLHKGNRKNISFILFSLIHLVPCCLCTDFSGMLLFLHQFFQNIKQIFSQLKLLQKCYWHLFEGLHLCNLYPFI